MIKVPENGQEGGQGQVRTKALLSLFCSSFRKRGVHEVEQASIKLSSCQFLGNPTRSRFSLGSLEAENMIKVLEKTNKVVKDIFLAFLRGEYMRLNKRE